MGLESLERHLVCKFIICSKLEHLLFIAKPSEPPKPFQAGGGFHNSNPSGGGSFKPPGGGYNSGGGGASGSAFYSSTTQSNWGAKPNNAYNGGATNR